MLRLLENERKVDVQSCSQEATPEGILNTLVCRN